jgi:hypothetical protein
MGGVLFGLSYIIIQKWFSPKEEETSRMNSVYLKIVLALTSLAAIFGYYGMTFICGNKVACNEIHPYTTFVPVSQNFHF